MAIPIIPLMSAHRLRSMSGDRTGEYDESYRQSIRRYSPAEKAHMIKMLDSIGKEKKKKEKKKKEKK